MVGLGAGATWALTTAVERDPTISRIAVSSRNRFVFVVLVWGDRERFFEEMFTAILTFSLFKEGVLPQPAIEAHTTLLGLTSSRTFI